jgi:ubiquitin carboxyl-terminal hydrolase 14
MNATVQAMRAIPELQNSLLATSGGTGPLSGSLRDLYGQMGKTTEGVVPLRFLQVLRQVVPQFGEVDRGKSGAMGVAYAQQDAEECWGAIANSLKEVPVSTAPKLISGTCINGGLSLQEPLGRSSSSNT